MFFIHSTENMQTFASLDLSFKRYWLLNETSSIKPDITPQACDITSQTCDITLKSSRDLPRNHTATRGYELKLTLLNKYRQLHQNIQKTCVYNNNKMNAKESNLGISGVLKQKQISLQGLMGSSAEPQNIPDLIPQERLGAHWQAHITSTAASPRQQHLPDYRITRTISPRPEQTFFQNH